MTRMLTNVLSTFLSPVIFILSLHFKSNESTVSEHFPSIKHNFILPTAFTSFSFTPVPPDIGRASFLRFWGENAGNVSGACDEAHTHTHLCDSQKSHRPQQWGLHSPSLQLFTFTNTNTHISPIYYTHHQDHSIQWHTTRLWDCFIPLAVRSLYLYTIIYLLLPVYICLYIYLLQPLHLHTLQYFFYYIFTTNFSCLAITVYYLCTSCLKP